jgi:YcxB-like protein
MELKYSLTEDDILELNLFRIRSIPQLQRRQKMLRWGYLIFMLILIALLYLMKFSLLVCLLMVLIVVSFFFYFPSYQKRQLRRMINKDYKDPERAAALVNRRAAATKDGIKLTTSKGEKSFPWHTIQKVETTPAAVFILLEDNGSFTISRARVEEGDFDQFVTEVTERSGKGRIIDLPAS